MNKVTLLAELPDGSVEKLRVAVTPYGLEHHRLRHLYDIGEQQVFPISRPTFAESLDALPEIKPTSVPERWMAIGEYNGLFPFSTHPVSSRNMLFQRLDRSKALFTMGFNLAAAKNAQKSLENPLLSTGVFLGMGVIAVFAIIAATALSLTLVGG